MRNKCFYFSPNHDILFIQQGFDKNDIFVHKNYPDSANRIILLNSFVTLKHNNEFASGKTVALLESLPPLFAKAPLLYILS